MARASLCVNWTDKMVSGVTPVATEAQNTMTTRMRLMWTDFFATSKMGCGWCNASTFFDVGGRWEGTGQTVNRTSGTAKKQKPDSD